jgi:GNAT superfamily N-acetyltransferase
MKYQLSSPTPNQLPELIAIRIAAMKPSLMEMGLYDPIRAAERFTNNYDSKATKCILVLGKTVGFYVLRTRDEHILIEHLYLHPKAQGSGIGASILSTLKIVSASTQKPLRLGALRGSKSNEFYERNGFKRTHESEFDIHYQFNPLPASDQA